GFKNRNGLRQFRKQGESASAPPAEQLENERKSLRALLRTYKPENIWNGDKTASFGE
ncbi:1340_t:CDS:1, partial [Paraglomus brasilianum]